MRTARQRLGVWGERIVADYYERRGYAIIARNYRCRFGELDLVCTKGLSLYSVEVKTRRSLVFGFPEESVLEQKKRRLLRLTAAYVAATGTTYAEVYVQICAVVVLPSKVMLRIYTL